MELLWNYQELLWNYYGITMELLWNYYGIHMELLWNSMESSGIHMERTWIAERNVEKKTKKRFPVFFLCACSVTLALVTIV